MRFTVPEAGLYRFPPYPPVKVENEGDLPPQPEGSVTVVQFPTEALDDGWDTDGITGPFTGSWRVEPNDRPAD